MFLNSPGPPMSTRQRGPAARSVANRTGNGSVSRLQSRDGDRLVNAGVLVMDLGHLIGDRVRFGGRID